MASESKDDPLADQTPDPKPERRQSYHHGDLREALLKAAAEELELAGVEAFSLRKVAKRAGVSHAAPAHHFGDANGLLTALAAEGYRSFVRFMTRREAEMGDPARAAGLGYIEFAESHTALFRLIFSSQRPSFDDPELQAASFAAFSHLCGLIEKRRGVSPFVDEDAMGDAIALWSMCHGLADLLASGRLQQLQALPKPEREAFLLCLLERALPPQEA